MIDALLPAGILALLTGILTTDYALTHLLTYLQDHTSLLEHYFPAGVPETRELLYNPAVRQQDLREDLLFTNALAVDENATNYLRGYRLGIILSGAGISALAIFVIAA